MLCGEAAGDDESKAGVPFVGKAGQQLERLLQRASLTTDDFIIANAISCRPPDNKLSGMPYMLPVINHCAPLLDATIAEYKPKVIVALGAIAMHRILGDAVPKKKGKLCGIQQCRGYVFWSDVYKCWVLPTYHPAFAMRGKTSFLQVILHDVQKAVHIAANGYQEDPVDYTLDPPPMEAQQWVDDFEKWHTMQPADADIYLSTDIETPMKQDEDEEDLDPEAGAQSETLILRCSYAYKPGHALSIPWDGPYRHIHQRLLNAAITKLFWNKGFDVPKILENGVNIDGSIEDGMVAWHILNSDLKKSLGFVLPFFANYPMWKHLSDAEPARYNAIDADAALTIMLGVCMRLRKNNLWKVYDQFVRQLDPVYASMTRAGMPVDRDTRLISSKQITAEYAKIRERLDAAVPVEAKSLSPKNGYVRPPADVEGLQQFTFEGIKVTRCSNCNEKSPKKSHFKTSYVKLCSRCGEKYTQAHVKVTKKSINPCAGAECIVNQTNPCGGATTVTALEGETRWARIEQFVPSFKGVLDYQKVMGHAFILEKTNAGMKPTTNEKAIRKLMGKYPYDKVYPLILDEREYGKIGGTYIGWAVEVEVEDDYILKPGEEFIEENT